MSGFGDNSGDTEDTFAVSDEQMRLADGNADEILREGLERIERLTEEKKGVADDIKDVFSELKAKGFDTKTLRQILRLRAMNPDDRKEQDMLLETYKASLGME